MSIKPIETRYKGYRFRSRLEARWAVFFDALRLEWEYEPQGFELPSGAKYLPDFLIRDRWLAGRIFVEIKRPGSCEEDWAKAKELSAALGVKVLLLTSIDQALRSNTLMLGSDKKWRWYRFDCGTVGALEDRSPLINIDHAVFAARAARFEHGECGVPA